MGNEQAFPTDAQLRRALLAYRQVLEVERQAEAHANALADANEAADDAADALAFTRGGVQEHEAGALRLRAAWKQVEELQGLVTERHHLPLLDARGSGPGGQSRPLGWGAHPGL